MAGRGPVPRDEAALARPRSRTAKRDDRPVTVGTRRRVGQYPIEADPDWDQYAIDLFEATRYSGQADFYQDSDWAMLRFLCGEVSDYIKGGRRSAQKLQAILSGLNGLLFTEGERRRARVELTGEPEQRRDFRLIANDIYGKVSG